MDMLEVHLLVDQCLHQAQEEACTLVVLQHPDPVDPPMHQYPQVVLPDSLLCHLEVQDILVHMEVLPDPDQCIQDHLDGVEDFLDLVHNTVVQDLVHNMVDHLVVPDLDHMAHNTVLDQRQTLGLDLKDQEQDHHTDLTK